MAVEDRRETVMAVASYYCCCHLSSSCCWPLFCSATNQTVRVCPRQSLLRSRPIAYAVVVPDDNVDYDDDDDVTAELDARYY